MSEFDEYNEKLILSILKAGSKRLLNGTAFTSLSSEDIKDVKILNDRLKIIFNKNSSSVKNIIESLQDDRLAQSMWRIWSSSCYNAEPIENNDIIIYSSVPSWITSMDGRGSFDSFIKRLFSHLLGFEVSSLEEVHLHLVLMGKSTS